ncbi:MAG: motility associated factor glycosyltransferase family protein [Phycisphaerae bacterium]|nr:motility associated factor glycosyltransferase family protein [Phycisphaerae bacterium]
MCGVSVAPFHSSASGTDEFYSRNMAALFRCDMRLAQLIDECEPDGSVVVEPSRRGPATVSVALPGTDRRVYLHSRVDPESEARQFADHVKIDKALCLVVAGFGLGHHLKALAAKQTGDAFLVVTEPNLQLLRAAFETVDLTDLFVGRRCLILTHTDKGRIQSILEPNNTLMMLGTQFVSHAASERVGGEFHKRMRQVIADHITFCRMSLVTLVANSRITCRNIVNNLPTFLSTPPINVLRDRFKGMPGVVIAAGPSLHRQLDQLVSLKGRAVLIAVQTVFKTLLERGVSPDFVTSLDYHEMSRRFFEDLPALPQTHLVVEPKATWHVLDTYGGPISVLGNTFAGLCLGEKLAARDGLKAGATVAHLSFYLAVYMGCDPIVLVGQDLAYTNHVYYTPGVAMHGLWRPQLNRFCTMEMMEWERIARSRPILMKVKDLHGRDVYTDEQLFTYLQQFEGDFATVPGRVIDATEGGVRKAGTRVMPLREVMEEYCTAEIPPERFAYLRELRWHDPSRLEAGRKELASRMEEVDRMADTCRRMMAVLEELEGLLDRPAEFNRRIARVDALRLEVQAQERTYQLISSVAQQAELQRFSTDRRLKHAGAEGVELARGQLERDKQFVGAIIEGADVLKEILRGGLERLDEAARRAAT